MRRQVSGAADTLMSFCAGRPTISRQHRRRSIHRSKSTIDKINAYAKQIAALNKQINTLEVNGGTANDLRDQRAKAVDELSALVDVEVVTDSPKDGNGVEEFLVFIGDGVLVDTYMTNQLKIEASTTKANQTDNEGLYNIKWSNGQNFNIRSGILGRRASGIA